VGTYCLTEDDVSPQSQHQTLGQAVGKFLQQHECQGLLGTAHHFSHAFLQGQDKGMQLCVPVLCREGTEEQQIGEGWCLSIEPMPCLQ
jgi:hypothetical protein